MRRKQGAEPKRKELEKKIEQKVPQSIPIRQPPPSTQRLPVAPQTQAPRPRFQQQQTQRFQQQPHPFRQQHQRQQFPSQQQRFQSQPQQQQRYNQQQREPKTRHLQTLTPTHGNPHSYPHQQQHQQQQQYQQQGNQQQQFYNNDNPSYANNNQQYNQQNNQQRMGRGGYQNQRVIKQINMLPEDAMPQQSYQQPPQRTIIPPRQRPNNNRTVVMLNEGGGGDNQSTCLVSNLSMSTNLGRVNNMASSCGRVLRVNQQPGPNGQRNIKVMFEDPRGAREFVSRFNRSLTFKTPWFDLGFFLIQPSKLHGLTLVSHLIDLQGNLGFFLIQPSTPWCHLPTLSDLGVFLKYDYN
ncbi:hypothetical protein CAPTEDRAFT_228999 [Capitella teleta]|uniref:RRM domain-containing protein n=1 Tax=Capitella teleta TaxID=283909 RepID=R7UQF1_CAPTE|nr:hypothetical protein CAPTEDRAFT_228999 [Capitella teleta]|eukprot:ELU05626.1 hypothetical protein CAPTEDRAFT_228999 [Capitella teleta]